MQYNGIKMYTKYHYWVALLWVALRSGVHPMMVGTGSWKWPKSLREFVYSKSRSRPIDRVLTRRKRAATEPLPYLRYWYWHNYDQLRLVHRRLVSYIHSSTNSPPPASPFIRVTSGFQFRTYRNQSYRGPQTDESSVHRNIYVYNYTYLYI